MAPCKPWIVDPKDEEAVARSLKDIKRRKSRCELIRISCAVMGIEFCYSAETAFVSPTILKIGLRHSSMSLVWCISPLIGFVATPLLGAMSDRCALSLGRRRPFVLALALGIVMGLMLVPNGRAIGVALGDDDDDDHAPSSNVTAVDDVIAPSHPPPHRGWGILFTVIGTVLLDFDADAAQSPSRAYLLDVTCEEDHVLGLSTFTLMAGLGGASGYAIGAVDWQRNALGTILGGQVRAVFFLVLCIFILCIVLTVTSFPELPPGVITLDGATQTPFEGPLNQGPKTRPLSSSRSTMHGRIKYEQFTDDEDEEWNGVVQGSGSGRGLVTNMIAADYGSVGPTWTPEGRSAVAQEETSFVEPPPSDVPGENHPQVNSLGSQSAASVSKGAGPQSLMGIRDNVLSLLRMPRELRLLCVTHLFSWMALVSYSLYFTDFVGESVFHGDPSAPHDAPQRALYEQGVRFACLAMALYSISCSAYSCVIHKAIGFLGARAVYVGGHVTYCLGMCLMAVLPQKAPVLLLSCSCGILYATLFTMPYILLAKLHASDQVCSGRGLGTDVAVLSSMVFVAQLTLSLCMGPLVHATQTTVTVVCAAALLAFCGAIGAAHVDYKHMD